VLVVDDELLIRLHAAEMVAAAGFEAVEAANADEAIAILEVRQDICVVFTDIDMPGSMDGLKLAAAVAKRWPPIKLIVTSGKLRVSPDQLPPGGRFFPKPYLERDIARTIREMIPNQ
jgi:DNA-binding NtrC family response regulator